MKIYHDNIFSFVGVHLATPPPCKPQHEHANPWNNRGMATGPRNLAQPLLDQRPGNRKRAPAGPVATTNGAVNKGKRVSL